MIDFNPKAFCKNCRKKQELGFTRCIYGERYMCSDYLAYLAGEALITKNAALQIPTELLLVALRHHGYSGELRKNEVVKI